MHGNGVRGDIVGILTSNIPKECLTTKKNDKNNGPSVFSNKYWSLCLNGLHQANNL